MANVLAEDHALGSRIRGELRAGVAVSSVPVWNIAVEKSLGHFFRRYLRWSVIHRTAISFPTYLAESLLNPIPLAVIGFALRPTAGAATTLAVCAVLKPTLDAVAFGHLRRELFSWRAFGVVWLKDLLLFATWVTACSPAPWSGAGTGSGCTRGAGSCRSRSRCDPGFQMSPASRRRCRHSTAAPRQ